MNSIHHNRLMVNALDKIDKKVVDNADFDGSPYLEDKFLPSKIEGEDGTHLLRYNIYNDEIVLRKDDEYFKVPKEGLEYFNIDNKYNIVLIDGKYYVQVSDIVNKYSVLKKESVRFIDAKPSENSYDQARKARFVKNRPDYFLYDRNNGKLIPFKKNDLEIAFSDKKDLIGKISKKNKLKSDEDYKDFFSELIK
ncbi:hypothetical protein [Chryseobacterium sp.]|uniref:hypothetical protein n=1 Tax=Chryseobacterium sp. TaxID=1871047 RepID=UPI002898D9F9|nr:hypothetical protein [Chryseobacterium sp.]